MTAPENSDSDSERFREDLIALKRDAATLIEHTKGSWTKTLRRRQPS